MDIELPLEISSRALQEVADIIKNKNIPAYYQLRLGLKGGACSANYLIGFDTKTDNDLLFQHQGVSIIIDKRHLMYMAGLRLHFEEGDDAEGFSFQKI